MYRLFFALLSIISLVSVVAQVGKTTRASLGAPLPPNGDTNRIAVSQTGRFIVYESLADDIVGNDTNSASDVFIYDWTDDSTERVSLTSTGVEANGASYRPDVSATGRFVVFQSAATNLVPGDTNGASDIFVRDRQTQNTFRVSVSTGGVQGNAVSSDCAISDSGDLVAYTSSATNLVAGDTNGVADAFVYDLSTGTTTHVSTNSLQTFPNVAVNDVAISGNGDIVVFSTSATNLFGGTNGVSQLYLRNLQAATTALISRHTSGAIGNAASRSPSIDYSGNVVGFRSAATNLVASDTNASDDVFVRNVASSVTQRASLSISGIQGNSHSLGAAVSSSGSAVAFQSTATNLVSGDTNGVSDVFRRDLVGNQTIRASVSNGEAQANGASTSAALGDASFIVFLSAANNLVAEDTNGADDGFVRFVQSGQTSRATNTSSYGDEYSEQSDVSASGRYVAFRSPASNLVPGDTNATWDIFLLDLYGLSMHRASVSGQGAQGNNNSLNPSVSGDGRRVAFLSWATNLVAGDTNGFIDVFVRDVLSGSTVRVSESSAGAQANHHSQGVVISGNGRYVAFSSAASNLIVGDTNADTDVFLHDLQTGVTTRISVSSSEQQANSTSDLPAISEDGSFVAFTSWSTNLVTGDTNATGDVFIRNIAAGTTERLSVSTAGTQANGISLFCDISADGTRVAFQSDATNLVAGDTNGERDVFVRDRVANTTARVSVSTAGTQGNEFSGEPSISGDGQSVAFHSAASNLVPNDLNGVEDIFVRSLALGTTRLVSISTDGQLSNGVSRTLSINRDGLAVSFMSAATNFDPLDTNAAPDIYFNDSRLTASVLTLTRGVVESGTGGSILFPDDIHYTVRPGITFTTTQAPIEFVVETVGLLLNPIRLEFAVEYSATAASIRQTIEMFNYDTQSYELVDTRQSTLTDAVVVIPITSNPGRFVSPTGQMRSRLAYKALGPVFAYPWRTKVDHIRWTHF